MRPALVCGERRIFNPALNRNDHVGVAPESVLSFDYLRHSGFLKLFIVGNEYQLACSKAGELNAVLLRHDYRQRADHMVHTTLKIRSGGQFYLPSYYCKLAL